MTDRSVICDTVAAMSYLQTSTGPVAYDECGEGLPIVMLPSGAHDRHDYDELRSLLPEGYRSISLDWPGHGESPAGEGAATAMRFADVAEQLVERLAPTGAVVLGSSVGGFAAARMAIRRPELVRGLVLLDSGGFAGRPLQVRAFCAPMSRRVRRLRAGGGPPPPPRRCPAAPPPPPIVARATSAWRRRAATRGCARSRSCG